MATKPLSVDLIRIDGDTQNRKSINPETITDYVGVWNSSNGEIPFPPVDVFHDGSDYWCADGFHRLVSAIEAKRGSIPCNIHKGGARDAFLFGCHANSKHGLRRTNIDKRFAVTRLLTDDEWCKLSGTKLAELAGVSRKYVLTIKAELAEAEVEKCNRSQPKRGNGSTNIDASEDTPSAGKARSEAGSGGGGQTHTAEAPAAEVDEPCPNCGCTDWDEDGDGWACFNCSHPWGEPAGDVDEPPPAKPPDPVDHAWSVYQALTEPQKIRFCAKVLNEDLEDKAPKKRNGFQPPRLSDVRAYCAERGKGIDAEAWYDHYTANGWKVGKNPMKDWKAAVRTWERGKLRSNGSDHSGTQQVIDDYLKEVGAG